ncbi:MAG TPA: glycosyltransferase family 2 protein [Pyrinomonadaceae bacterium]|nr:glycosyltransferase family 2 protein [Pyrinomonadaceae bacterium]
MKSKISVITATLNRKELLARCIEGVARQTYPNKEHIIVDGASTDGTVEVLESSSRRYPHLRWISEKDNGISDALNKGLALATGDIIGVNGDDDCYQPGAFEIVAAEFERNPDVGVVSGHCDNVRNDGTVAFTQKAGFTSRLDLIAYWKNWGNSVFLPAPSTFFRRRAVDVVGGFDEADRYAMDYHHWIKMTETFEVRIVNQVLARFRYDEGTVTFSRSKEQAAETHAISRKYWGSRASLSYYRMAFSYFDFHNLYPLRERIRNSFKYRLSRLRGRSAKAVEPDR